MTIDQIERIAVENGVEISDVPLRDLRALCTPEGWIAIDARKVETGAQEKTLLAHELGHFMTGSFYNIYTEFDSRAKHEYRADKWAVHRLMPYEDIQAAIRSGVRNDWEMAEYFGVPCDFVEKARGIYKIAELANEEKR